jgi:two-component lantibiotic alpha peptide
LYQGDIPLIEEINEQDVDEMFGATSTITITTIWASPPLGNKGQVCTLTKECQASCN